MTNKTKLPVAVEDSTADDSSPSYIVGIGASAGGLEAIENLVKNMVTPTGLAYVIVQHLSPDYKSLMNELLAKYTDIPINRIEDGMRIEKDNIYLISPRKNITLFHGTLISVDREDGNKGQINLPINTFFESLAEDQGPKAIGIVLSGTGSDGTRGIRAIKEHGGMTMAQLPESAKFDSMPKSAISTNLVDYISPPEVMPQQLLDFTKHPFAKHPSAETIIQESDNGLARIFSLLRERHGVDFTYYKPSTIIRRVERRITINQCQSLQEYNQRLDQRPHEITNLFQELLIGVTNFFRDEAVFNYIKLEIIPMIIKQVEARASYSPAEIRLWVAGCSTGEEAYSLAMLFQDYIETNGLNIKIKIFATDVDGIAIEKASLGLYPSSIVGDVPPEYLAKYFVDKDEFYQINRQIRESVVFAQHDLLKDPPFTNIDMISCRNLLIYLQPVLQKKVLESFNFSLKQDSILLLGSSETLGEMDEYFEFIHAKNKLFKSLGKARILGMVRQQSPKSWSTMSPNTAKIHHENESLLRLTEERFYNRFIEALSQYEILPLTLIADSNVNVSHVYGDSSQFLRYTHGKIVTDIAKIVIPELSIPVTTGIQKCIKTNQPILLTNIKVRNERDDVTNVDIQIFPMIARANQESLYCILIRKSSPLVESQSHDGLTYNVGLDAEQRIADLEQELQFSRESLQATVEELETSNEELQATNEELLASNEELQSTNEELQSVNEELYTVNAEYQSKISELTILNTDMDNLFDSTQTAALFLDENLEIRRFTPKLSNILNILTSDLGRPLSDLSINLGDDIDLQEIIRTVMFKGTIEEHEFKTADSKWHLLRVTPYAVSKTINSGVVLTIIEIDVLKRTQTELLQKMRKEADRLASIMESSDDAYVQYQPNGLILSWSKGAERIFGYSKEEASNMTIYDMLPNKEKARVEHFFESFNEEDTKALLTIRKLKSNGSELNIILHCQALRDADGSLIIIAREQREELEVVSKCVHCVDNIINVLSPKNEAIILVEPNGIITSWNKGAETLLGWTHDEIIRKPIFDLIDANSTTTTEKLNSQLELLEDSQSSEITFLNKAGKAIDITISITPIGDDLSTPYIMLKCAKK